MNKCTENVGSKIEKYKGLWIKIKYKDILCLTLILDRLIKFSWKTKSLINFWK